jgi:hypothetical protein
MGEEHGAVLAQGFLAGNLPTAGASEGAAGGGESAPKMALPSWAWPGLGSLPCVLASRELFLFVFSVLGMEPRASHMLGKCSGTKFQPPPPEGFLRMSQHSS